MKIVRDVFGVSSPCVAVCKLENGICVGCGRTIDEIDGWAELEQPEKKQIIERAAQRCRELGLGKPAK